MQLYDDRIGQSLVLGPGSDLQNPAGPAGGGKQDTHFGSVIRRMLAILLGHVEERIGGMGPFGGSNVSQLHYTACRVGRRP